MSERIVDVVIEVSVKMDESKFTPEFMQEFRDNFYPFTSIEDHVNHLAQLAAREVIHTPCFIEGYGNSEDMGIEVNIP